MAEDANTQESVSSTDSSSQADSTSQSAANSTSQNSGNEGFHNHPRWQEMVQEKNQLKQQNEQIMREMEQIKSQMKPQTNNAEFEDVIREYKSMDIDETAARRLVELQSKVAERQAQKILQPISEATLRTRVEMKANEFYKEHKKDIDEMKPEMISIMNSMDPQDRRQVTSMSDGGLSYLYERAKNKKLSELVEKSKNEGRQEAYENKALKNSLSSSSSSSSAQEPVLSPKQFIEEYSKLSEEDMRKNAGLYEAAKRRLILGK